LVFTSSDAKVGKIPGRVTQCSPPNGDEKLDAPCSSTTGRGCFSERVAMLPEQASLSLAFLPEVVNLLMTERGYRLEGILS
jgi:hypothetical protein